jgi:hypothetical protein
MKYKVKSVITNLIIIFLINLWVISPVAAVTQELQFQTTSGYLVKTTFSYDQAGQPQMISEHGQGKTKFINSLEVSFYKPSGELMGNYNNIVNGIATGAYFEFNFTPATQQLSGNLDIGGESAGEIYLKGTAEQELFLIEVTESGIEKAIAHVNLNSGSSSNKRVLPQL